MEKKNITTSNEIETPRLLDIPLKLLPIVEHLDEYRYFLADGGRGGGKSNAIARLILYLTEKYTIRVVCGREIQRSIEESVYLLFCDLIRKFRLNFDIQATRIIHRVTGSVINFRGFRELGAVNIKGLEGISIVWIDEAQAITKTTLDILIPTIRKENSKVFFSMNRYLSDDPVYMHFKDREDCLRISINYYDNEFCPEALKIEAELSKKKNIEDYKHIWLGEPLPQANAAAFRDIDEIVGDYDGNIEPVPGLEYSLGVDLAKSVDHTVLTVVNKNYKRVDYFEQMQSENKTSWHYQKEKIKAVSQKYNNALVVIDSTGLGDPIVEDLIHDGVNVYFQQKPESNKETPGVKFNVISKERLIEKLKVAIEEKMITIPNNKIIISELKDFKSVALPSGNYRYSAPEGKHDDAVISLSLAWWGLNYGVYIDMTPKPKPTPIEDFWAQVKTEIKYRGNPLTNEYEERFIEDESNIISD